MADVSRNRRLSVCSCMFLMNSLQMTGRPGAYAPGRPCSVRHSQACVFTGLGPKISVPTRMMVAPSSMASR